ncbi:MAG: PAS domain S-box protein, partial [Candidatus Kariarchaeaceae archaeon]
MSGKRKSKTKKELNDELNLLKEKLEQTKYELQEANKRIHLDSSGKISISMESFKIDHKELEQLEFTHAGVFIHENGIVREMNNAITKMFGYTEDEIIGSNLLDFVHPDYKTSIHEKIKNFDYHSSEIALIKKDGTELLVHTIATPIQYDGRKARIVYIQDISELQKAQKKLIASEKKLRKLMENSPNRIVLLDTKGIVKYVNFVRHHESTDDVIGDDILDYVNPNSKKIFKKSFQRTIKNNEITKFEIDTTWGSRDLIEFHPLTENNHVNEVVLTAVDITEMRNIELELKESEERYRVIFDSAPVGIVVFQSNKLQYINKTALQMFNYSINSKLEGKHVGEFVAKSELERLLKMEWLRAEGEEIPSAYETIGVKSDGTHFPIHLDAVAIQYEGLRAIQVFVGDLTETKLIEERNQRLQDQIERSNKLDSLGVLAGGIAHDFNNLLMAIMGNASIGRLELESSHPVYGLLDEIEGVSKKAAELAQQMLAFSGRSKLNVDSVDLSSVVDKIKDLLLV